MATMVFGGAGFVGLNIVEQLLARGEPVTVFDASPLPAAAVSAFGALPGSLNVVVGDVTDPAAVAAAAPTLTTAVIYGAAITAGADRDRDDPQRTLEVNLNGLMNALQLAKAAKAERFINLSSAGAFGRAAFAHEVLTEETEADPQSLYAITKFASERITARMAEVWGIDAISVRLSGVYGRWERHTLVRDTPSPHFQILAAARAGRPAILPRRDGRDFTAAPDIAAAVLALRDSATLRHSLYHISTGVRIAVIDWANAFKANWPSLQVAIAKSPGEATINFHAETDRGVLSIARLKADTGFQPTLDIAAVARDYAIWAKGQGADYP